MSSPSLERLADAAPQDLKRQLPGRGRARARTRLRRGSRGLRPARTRGGHGGVVRADARPAVPGRSSWLGLGERASRRPKGYAALDLRAAAPRAGRRHAARAGRIHVPRDAAVRARADVCCRSSARDGVTGEARDPSSTVVALLRTIWRGDAERWPGATIRRDVAAAVASRGCAPPARSSRPRPASARRPRWALPCGRPRAARPPAPAARRPAPGARARGLGGARARPRLDRRPPATTTRRRRRPSAAAPPSLAAADARWTICAASSSAPCRAAVRVLLPMRDDDDATDDAESALREHERLDEVRARLRPVPARGGAAGGSLAERRRRRRLAAAYDEARPTARLDGMLADGLFGGRRARATWTCCAGGETGSRSAFETRLARRAGPALVRRRARAPARRRHRARARARRRPRRTVRPRWRSAVAPSPSRASATSWVAVTLIASVANALPGQGPPPWLVHAPGARRLRQGRRRPRPRGGRAAQPLRYQAGDPQPDVRADVGRRGPRHLADLAGELLRERPRLLLPVRGGLQLARASRTAAACATRSCSSATTAGRTSQSDHGPVPESEELPGARRATSRGAWSRVGSGRCSIACPAPRARGRSRDPLPVPEELDAIPRDRSTVIEASAGTGKTFLIEHLVVDRLIRGDGHAAGDPGRHLHRSRGGGAPPARARADAAVLAADGARRATASAAPGRWTPPARARLRGGRASARPARRSRPSTPSARPC